MSKEPRIPVMELFGPTIQGEGLMTGTVTHFLRTGGCGLRCDWCDSMFAVLPAEIKKGRMMLSIPEILQEIEKLPTAPYLTLTGGDPCLHKHLGDIIPGVNAMGTRIAVETQGELFPDWLTQCDVLTFSPKGPSSGNVVDPEPLRDFLVAQGPRTRFKRCIKVVVFNEADFGYALHVYNAIPDYCYDAFYITAGTPINAESPFARQLAIIQNEQAIAAQILQAAQTMCFNEKVHLGCQVHALLWPDQDKGV